MLLLVLPSNEPIALRDGKRRVKEERMAGEGLGLESTPRPTLQDVNNWQVDQKGLHLFSANCSSRGVRWKQFHSSSAHHRAIVLPRYEKNPYVIFVYRRLRLADKKSLPF